EHPTRSDCEALGCPRLGAGVDDLAQAPRAGPPGVLRDVVDRAVGPHHDVRYAGGEIRGPELRRGSWNLVPRSGHAVETQRVQEAFVVVGHEIDALVVGWEPLAPGARGSPVHGTSNHRPRATSGMRVFEDRGNESGGIRCRAVTRGAERQ